MGTPVRSAGPCSTGGSTRRDRRRMCPRRGTRGLRSSRGPLLAPPFRTSWPRGTRNPRSGRPRGSRPWGPPRTLRSRPPRRPLLETRRHRRLRRLSRMSRSPPPRLEERDKQTFVGPYLLYKLIVSKSLNKNSISKKKKKNTQKKKKKKKKKKKS